MFYLSFQFVEVLIFQYDLSVKYLPVKVEATTAVLTISNPAVGNYTYNLSLEALAPNSELEVHFRTQLGQNETKIVYLPKLLQGSDIVGKVNDFCALNYSQLYNFSQSNLKIEFISESFIFLMAN